VSRGKAGEEARDDGPHKAVTESIIAAAFKVQSALGPGLLESTYEACLAHELRKTGHHVLTQVALDIVYDDLQITNAYRMDMVVDDTVVLELKTIDQLIDMHHAQLFTYLRFSGKKVGLLLNFWAWPMKDGGIKRVINTR
jgi:GxxExxY protein